MSAYKRKPTWAVELEERAARITKIEKSKAQNARTWVVKLESYVRSFFLVIILSLIIYVVVR